MAIKGKRLVNAYKNVDVDKIRITSYNVCYTKLLRYLEKGKFDSTSLSTSRYVAISGGRITSYNVCYTKLLRSCAVCVD